ncbi:MAG: hypothetical protein CSA07_04725 [Bacteroidia bacterium]|nr:MAG: hypothetical protein CSA07_04725 [Bacteroidia bacterium]
MSARSERKRHLRYRFERFMSKGPRSILLSLVLAFLVAFGVIALVRACLLWLASSPDAGAPRGLGGHLWYVFLQMTDPGNMALDGLSSGWLLLATVVAGVTGVILFSILIAFLTTALEQVFYELRRGRGPIIEAGHTLILGWNESIIDILRELVEANESQRKATVVICAELDKAYMDDYIANRLHDSKTTAIVTTTGNPSSLTELRRISARKAKSAIILSASTENSPIERQRQSDIACVNAVMSLRALQNEQNRLPIVPEILTPKNRELLGIFQDERIVTLDKSDILGRLLFQTSLSSGLEMVYRELFSFEGNEVYFYRAPWQGVTFGQLPYHFPDGVPLGISRGGRGVELMPPEDTTLGPDDEVLILAEDDSTISFSPRPLYQARDFPYTDVRLEPKNQRILILGWHSIAHTFVREASEYLAEGFSIDVMLYAPPPTLRAEVQRLGQLYPKARISLREVDVWDIDRLRAIEPYAYDSVVVLSQNPAEKDPEVTDSETLMLLLLLKRLEQQVQARERHTKVIANMLCSDRQELILQTNVDDFIISNVLISSILSQLSEEYRLKDFYDDLFTADGFEIYVKPASLYFTDFPVRADFVSLMHQARKRREICLGVRFVRQSRDAESNFGIRLNPKKDQVLELSEGDYLVVLAEDHL